MKTLVGTQKDFGDALKNLVELDYAVIASYQEAVEHVENEEIKNKLEEFSHDHLRHVKELSEVLEDLSKEPPTSAGVKQLFTQGKVILANLMGDKAILKALKSNEEDTRIAYERLTEHPAKAAYATDPLKRGLEDDKRHLIWIEDTIEKLD